MRKKCSIYVGLLVTIYLIPNCLLAWDGPITWWVDVPDNYYTVPIEFLSKERTYLSRCKEGEIYETFRLDSDVIGVFYGEEEFSVIDVISSWWEEGIPMGYGGDPEYIYVAWYKIKQENIEGWVAGDSVYMPLSGIVYFGDEYYPLREGPSTTYEPLTSEDQSIYTDLTLHPQVESGSIFEIIFEYNGWLSVGRTFYSEYGRAGGWLPLDNSCLEFYVPAFGGTMNEADLGGSFNYKVPWGSASKRIYSESEGFPGSRMFIEGHKVTVVDKTGAEIVFTTVPDTEWIYTGSSFILEYLSDKPVNWANVEKVKVEMYDPYSRVENDEFFFEFPGE